jgi:5'-nucleotidase (lipoprotein e(P4) family)
MKKILFLIASFILTQIANSQDSSQSLTKIQTESLLKELPVLWQQTASEYRALCYQAFNIANLRLNEIPKRRLKKQKIAIITDLDETILDNSYHEAKLIIENQVNSNESWKDCTSKSTATAVPGSVVFLQAAHQRGITIFYISNRDTGDVANTLINLKKLQLPDADTSHMLFLSNTSSKETRRQIVMKDYNVVMLLGDNLNDFTQVFEKKTVADRLIETDKTKEDWGKKFIVLPNSTYGEWENAIYDYEKKLTPVQKENKRMGKLKDY